MHSLPKCADVSISDLNLDEADTDLTDSPSASSEVTTEVLKPLPTSKGRKTVGNFTASPAMMPPGSLASAWERITERHENLHALSVAAAIAQAN